MSPIDLTLSDTGRQLTVRFRLRWSDTSAPRFEALDTDRPFGLPFGDILPLKPHVDVLLEGAAYPTSAGAGEGRVQVLVGAVRRSLRIFGRREVTWSGGRIRFTSASSFERIPLDLHHAYGGACEGILYARNPKGKGFLVEGAVADGVELPNIEEESEMLTPERLFARPEQWWEQPRPAIVESAAPVLFPRTALLGLTDAGAPFDARLAEVRDGDIPKAYAPTVGRPDKYAFQEAPRRSRLALLVPGEPILVDGCLAAGHAWRSSMPRAPMVGVVVDGRVMDLDVRPQTLRLRPEQNEVSVTYAARLELPRAFIPGLHRRIPISVAVEGTQVDYVAPETTQQILARHPQQTFGGEP